MLAARKKVYAESIELIARKKQVKRIMLKVFPQSVPKPKVLPVVFIVIMVFTACFSISRFAEISRNHGLIMSLERDLMQRQDTTRLLELELTSKKDLSRIEKIAATEIGMRYPDKAQVQYIVLPEVFDNTSAEPGVALLLVESGNSSGKSIWERIFRIFVP